jgi:predicted Zn-dependent protease with MMP-like domain
MSAARGAVGAGPGDWAYAEAREAVRGVLRRLPAELRRRAEEVPVVYEARPSRQWQREGLAADTLGVMDGDAFPEEPAQPLPLPPRIFLFVENLREYAGGDRPRFREEVRVTYLHELGHYLGLEEGELADRGLE